DPRQGLPSPHVTVLLETAGGGLLAGTTAGLARLALGSTAASRIFEPVTGSPGASRRLGRISALLAEGGSIWLADSTVGGGPFRPPPQGDPSGREEVKGETGKAVAGATSLALGGAGGLWVGGQAGLQHRSADGRWNECPLLPASQSAGITALLLDSQHRL